MIYFRGESDVVRNGFNFYRLSDPASIGFIFRIHRWGLIVRWSKVVKKLFIYTRVEPKKNPFDDIL